MRFRARSLRILSLLVLLAVTNVFVFANGAVVSSGRAANESGSAKILLGKLITISNRPILVNGGEAITGTIILSGAELITPSAGGATVQLDKVGTVLIAPSSNVALMFDQKSVTVRVASGNATVTTVDGVAGTVVGADGLPASGSGTPAPAGGSHLTNGEIAGIVLGGTGLVIGIVGWKKSNDARDDARAANAAAAAAAANAAAANAALAALRTCVAGQTASPVKLCTSF